MEININFTSGELIIVRKALSDLSYNIYCGKASAKWKAKENEVDELYDRIFKMYNELEAMNNG